MDQARKKIIIEEINAWKESRMLPEQYCDFLLALYHQGEAESKGVANKARKKSSLLPLAVMAFLFFATVFLNYFTEITSGMQLLLSAVASGIYILLGIKIQKDRLLFPFALAGTSLLLLLATVKFTEWIAPSNNPVLYAALFFHCGVWVMLGKRFKYFYFTLSGIIGAIIIFYFLIKGFYIHN